MRKINFFVAVLAMILTANVQAGVDPAVAKSINEAIQETEKAARVGFEWRDTYKIIGKAKEAARMGDNENAFKLANQAKRQSQAAQQQARDRANAGPNF